MRLAINGIKINVEQAEQANGHPIMLLHGFTGSAATWAPYAFSLARHARPISVDLIGHGESDAPDDPARYRMDECVRDLLAVMDSLEVAQTDLVGYSMGARVALHLATAAPTRVRAIILESASPGLADAAERQARQASDAALAETIEQDGMEAFVNTWERLPLFASQSALSDEARARLRAQRLANNRIGLANSLRGMGVGQQEPPWGRLPTIKVPTLLLAGALDKKYAELARSMAAAMPMARATIVPNAGHAVHLEQPAVFLKLVSEFLISEPRP